MKGIGIDPAVELRPSLIQVALVAGKQEGLREQHQVLVPVQLPDDLVIAGFRSVQIRHAAEIVQTCFLAIRVVATPEDFWSRFDGQAEQRKAVLENLSGSPNYIRCEAAAFQANSDELGIETEVMRGGVEVSGKPGRIGPKRHVAQLLSQSKRDFSGAAQTVVILSCAIKTAGLNCDN